MPNEGDEGTVPEFDLPTTLKAAKEAGVNLLTEEQLNKRLSREKRKRDEMHTKMEEYESRLGDYATKLEEYENKGKSEEQKRLEEYTRLEKQRDAYKAQVDEVRGQAEQRAAELQRYHLEKQVSTVLQDRAANLARATLIAQHEMRGLGLDEHNRLSYIDPETEIEYSGSDAVEKLKGWWDGQHDLHRARPGGPPATSTKPNGESGASDWNDPNKTLEERVAELGPELMPR